jgi:integrase
MQNARRLEGSRNPKPSDRVFPCEVKNFDQGPWFNAAVAEAKIDHFTWHNNRHTFCSWLAMAGVSLKEIQELAGHKTIQMSARTPICRLFTSRHQRNVWSKTGA